MAVQVDLVTAEMLAALPDTGERTELVRGEVIAMSPAGAEHGAIAITIGAAMYDHVRRHRLGRVYAETGAQAKACTLAREAQTLLDGPLKQAPVDSGPAQWVSKTVPACRS